MRNIYTHASSCILVAWDVWTCLVRVPLSCVENLASARAVSVCTSKDVLFIIEKTCVPKCWDANKWGCRITFYDQFAWSLFSPSERRQTNWSRVGQFAILNLPLHSARVSWCFFLVKKYKFITTLMSMVFLFTIRYKHLYMHTYTHLYKYTHPH